MEGPALATLILFVIGTTLAPQSPGSAQQKPLNMGQADSNTFVGIISDSFCGPRHKLPDKSGGMHALLSTQGCVLRSCRRREDLPTERPH